MATNPQLRDTDYATELATASITFEGGSEARIERLLVKEYNQEEIRFSWWIDGRMIPRPLDLSENDLFQLLRNGIQANVITPEFRARLRQLL